MRIKSRLVTKEITIEEAVDILKILKLTVPNIEIAISGTNGQVVSNLQIGLDEENISESDYEIIFNNFIQDNSNVKFFVLKNNKDGYIQILNSNKVCFLLKESMKRGNNNCEIQIL